jgi:hypothetical protein
MKERRTIRRRYLLYYARIFDTSTRQQVGNLVDITTHGAMALSPKAFVAGQTYRLRIELSDDISDRADMEISMIARWSHPDIEPRLFNTGFEFLEVGKDEEAVIKRIVEIYGFRDNLLPRAG